ncbi:MAG: hypothetical protein ACD_19C00015G0010 [uncultured bacterium]|nr:MAG: hypothetical protein ACD_19C00015G0010 [uncultured bacterium]
MSINDRINLRLKKLLQYVNKLKKYQGITSDELIKDSDKRDIIERNLHLACEIVIDTANSLNSEFRLPPPTDNKFAIMTLGEAGILEKKFADELSGLAPFRNVLVHDYLELDFQIVADVLNNKLDDFVMFSKIIAEFLQKNSSLD